MLFFLDEITASFRRFGHLFVDWPHKAESKSYFPPKGMLRVLGILLHFKMLNYFDIVSDFTKMLIKNDVSSYGHYSEPHATGFT